MKAERKLASDIIDLVEDRIREIHPLVDSLAQSFEHNNTLLIDENYYNLEDEITALISSFGSNSEG